MKSSIQLQRTEITIEMRVFLYTVGTPDMAVIITFFYILWNLFSEFLILMQPALLWLFPRSLVGNRCCYHASVLLGMSTWQQCSC